jgi:hypothetical protein
MQMMLELAVAAETESLDDAYDGGWIRFELLRHGAHAQQNVFPRVLQDRANDLLTFYREFFNGLREVGRRHPGPGFLLFHGARELPKSTVMSTLVSSLSKN